MEKLKERNFQAKMNRLRREDKLFYLFMFVAVFAAALYVALGHSKTMPFAEGWYTYYAQLINEKGLLPYRDFEYLFSPLYIYFIAVVTRIFGYNIIVLRRLGILMFGVIALGVYLFITEIVGRKKAWIAAVATVTATLYLQSEVVQIFYDYIRLMDIFAVFTVLFLMRAVKAMQQEDDQKKKINLIFCGLFNGFFINVKQNVGLIFWAYTVVLLIYLGIYFHHSAKRIVKDLLAYLIPLAVVTVVIYLLLAVTGGLTGYLSMTGGGAISAKGGILAILFNWVPNNMRSFKQALPQALPMLLGLVILVVGREAGRLKDKTGNGCWEKLADAMGALYLLGIIALFILEARHASVAYYFVNWSTPTTYWFFEIVFPAFLAFGFWFLYNIIKKTNKADDYTLWFALSGAYVAISWGCGNSGGLAEGQATTGVAFVVALTLYCLSYYRWIKVLQVAVVAACAGVTIQSASKKMVKTYYWWGADEADFWNSKEEIETIPLLRGIHVSNDTKEVYEEIYKEITENTDTDDTIYCFPQIPIFYSLCDRYDPGVRSKVEWFDVSTDSSVEADIDVLTENPPKAILMYDVGANVYDSHERIFRNGGISGTRKMREFLYNYVYVNDYTFVGIYKTGTNVLQLWIKGEDAENKETAVFDSGDGTFENPYTLHTAEQLVLFSKMVNDGRTFEGQYIEQTTDIDMSGIAFTPIGEIDGESCFKGTYNGKGHVIGNLSIQGKATEDVGLFGRLEGAVYNLGLEAGSLTGDCVGAIASYAVNPEAEIVNCFTDVDVTGSRAGGITDNFAGSVVNCVSAGALTGGENADAIAYNSSIMVENVYQLTGQKTSLLDRPSIQENRVSYADEDVFNSDFLVKRLNAAVREKNKANGESGAEEAITLVEWTEGTDGHPVLVPEN